MTSAWSQHPWPRPKSPRNRGKGGWQDHQEPASPRRRAWPQKGTPKGAQKGQPKGKGSGKSQLGREPPAAADPTTGTAQQLLQLLPTAPQMGAPALPSQQAVGESPEKSKDFLELVSALASQKEDLPLGVQALLEAHMATNHKSEAKAMHKLVHQQGQAKIELSNVRRSRAQFLQEWHLYLQRLTDLLAQQMKKKNESLQSYAEAEERWESQLRHAARAMQTASGVPIEVASEDEEAMEAQEAEVSQDAGAAAARQTAVEAATERELALMAALASATETAQAQAQEYRERTPRRSKSGACSGFSTVPTKAATDTSKEGPKEAPPGRAQ